MALEISFSVVQLIVTLIYFILAELGVKNSFNASVFPLVFAIVAAVFTFNTIETTHPEFPRASQSSLIKMNLIII